MFRHGTRYRIRVATRLRGVGHRNRLRCFAAVARLVKPRAATIPLHRGDGLAGDITRHRGLTRHNFTLHSNLSDRLGGSLTLHLSMLSRLLLAAAFKSRINYSYTSYVLHSTSVYCD